MGNGSYIIHRAAKYHTINAIKYHIEGGSLDAEDREKIVELVHTPWTDSKIKSAYQARKNAVIGIEGLYTATPETINEWSEAAQMEFFENCLEWHRKHYGSIIITAYVHYHESSPHLHVLSIPEKDGKLNASKLFGNIKAMTMRQQEIWEDIGKAYGLERGREGSKEEHKPVYKNKEAMKLLEELKRKNDEASRLIEDMIAAQQRNEAYKERNIPAGDYNPTREEER